MNSNTQTDKEIVIKQFESTKELYYWLGETDMEELKIEMKEKYGSNSGRVDLIKNQFIITLK